MPGSWLEISLLKKELDHIIIHYDPKSALHLHISNLICKGIFLHYILIYIKSIALLYHTFTILQLIFTLKTFRFYKQTWNYFRSLLLRSDILRTELANTFPRQASEGEPECKGSWGVKCLTLSTLPTFSPEMPPSFSLQLCILWFGGWDKTGFNAMLFALGQGWGWVGNAHFSDPPPPQSCCNTPALVGPLILRRGFKERP